MIPYIKIFSDVHFSVYGFFMWLGFVLFVFAIYEFSRDHDSDVTDITIMSTVIFVCAYLLALVTYKMVFKWEFGQGWNFFLTTYKGELFFWGGVLGGIIGYFLYSGSQYSARMHCMRLDRLGIAAPIALMSGKLGCFFQGCCFGSPTLESVRVCYPLISLPTIYYQEFKLIHPAQMYEAVGYGFLFLYLVTFAQKTRFPGQIFGRALVGVCVVRLMGWRFRGDLQGLMMMEWPMEYVLEGSAVLMVLLLNLVLLIARKICKP